jgi:membrane-bound serine protease (ClpP class)
VTVFFFFLTLAIGLLVFELYIPGGVLGIAGALCLAAAVLTAYIVLGRPTAHYVLVVALVGYAIYLWWSLAVFPKSRFAGPVVNTTSIERPDHGLDHLVGKEGVATTTLRPAGTAEVEGEPVDVITEGKFVPAGEPVRVVRVEGPRVVVRRTERST